MIFKSNQFEMVSRGPNIALVATYDKLDIDPSELIGSFYVETDDVNTFLIFKYYEQYTLSKVKIFKYVAKHAMLGNDNNKIIQTPINVYCELQINLEN